MLGVGFRITDLRCQRCHGPISLGAIVWVILGISAAIGGVTGFLVTQGWLQGDLTSGQLLVAAAGLLAFSTIVGTSSWYTLHAKPRR